MATVDHLRNSLIDKLMAISSKEYLEALNNLVENSSVTENSFTLSKPQVEMLQMSEEDIQYNRLVSQEQLDAEDLKWLNDQ